MCYLRQIPTICCSHYFQFLLNTYKASGKVKHQNSVSSLEWLVHSQVQVPDLILDSPLQPLYLKLSYQKVQSKSLRGPDVQAQDIEQRVARQMPPANNQLLWTTAGIKEYILHGSLLFWVRKKDIFVSKFPWLSYSLQIFPNDRRQTIDREIDNR